jgi:hypothetical protein
MISTMTYARSILIPTGSAGTSHGVEAILAAQTTGMLRQLAVKAVATLVTVTVTTVAIYQIVKEGRRPNSKGRLILFGKDMGAASEHMGNAISNGKSRILTRTDEPHPRGWWLAMGLCLDATIANLKDCDEYPFSSVKEGGKNNFLAGRVSLKSLNRSDNRRVGNLLQRFYNDPACKFNFPVDPLRGIFGVLVDEDVPRSEYFCKMD